MPDLSKQKNVRESAVAPTWVLKRGPRRGEANASKLKSVAGITFMNALYKVHEVLLYRAQVRPFRD